MARHHSEILIIGAGISGLLAGKMLSQAGRDVLILEKSRGVGGRMATRRFRNGVFDHGAQFFTVRDKEFQHWVRVWRDAKVVEIWFGHKSKVGKFNVYEKHPRFIGINGMTSVPKELAKGLVIHMNTQVISISLVDNQWVVTTDKGEEYGTSNIIISAPIPQSLNLLEAGDVFLPRDKLEALKSIDYLPCITGLILMEYPSAIPSPGGKKFNQGIIQWLGDNTKKGISPEVTAVTIHASSKFSRDNFELPADEIFDLLISASAPYLRQEVLDWQIHKWRYSQPVKTYPEEFLVIPEFSGLYMIGDGFGGAKVEGAALSGIRAGEYLCNKLRKHAY